MVNNIGIRYVTNVLIDFDTRRTPLTNAAPPDEWNESEKKRNREKKSRNGRKKNERKMNTFHFE